MDKCWFVLKQVHYYPPPDDCIRQGIPEAPLCLGHLVPSLRQLDHVINAEEFVPFEKRMMPSCATTRHDFVWDQTHSREVGVLGRASLPLVGAVPGVEASAALGGLFSKHVANYHRFSSLEQWITSPTRSYINKCLRTREVQEHIARASAVRGWWTMYMITGLAIARGVGVMKTTEKQAVDLVNSIGCQIPGTVEVGPEVSFAAYERSRMTAQATTDFVWAVRLAKITKNGLQRDWSIETVFGRATILGRRATFSADPFDSTFNPSEMLAAERLNDSEFEVASVTMGTEEDMHFISIIGEEDKEEDTLGPAPASEDLPQKGACVASEALSADC